MNLVLQRGNRPLRYFWLGMVILLAISMLIPYYWMVLSAFKPVPELNRLPPRFYIENPALTNFYDPLRNTPPDHVEGLFQRYTDTPGGFMRFYFNSVFLSSVITACTLLIASMAAFVLSKHNFPGREFFFILFVASMMIPWQVTIISNFLQVRNFGWLDSYWAMIIPALPKAFAAFFCASICCLCRTNCWMLRASMAPLRFASGGRWCCLWLARRW